MEKEPRKNIDHDFLATYFAGQSTPEQKEQLVAWLKASDENVNMFHESKLVWSDIGALQGGKEYTFDVDKAWNTFKVNNITTETVDFWYWPMRIAAILIILVGVVATYYLTKNQSPDLNTIATTSEQIDIKLADGTSIKLNSESEITYPKSFDPSIRTVNLKGEAYFSVSHDPNQPFEVKVGEATVRVLGTAFNIKQDQGITVSVESGIVQFSTPGEELILEAGMTGKFDGNNLILVGSAPDASFWRNRRLVFAGTPLIEVVSVLNKNYGVSISLNDSIASCNLTATFNDEPLDIILEIIASTFKLEKESSGDNYSLTGESCEP